MRIQNNITAMNTHRQYTINNDNVAKSAEKLSSGYRINRAGDDAAGLAISEKMRSQIRGLNMATKNSQDAISLVQTAEGALQETHSMLQRMNELAVQAATGTNEDLDRTALAKEFEQLKREINDVAEQTNFNNMKILDGSMSYEGYVRSATTAGVNNSASEIKTPQGVEVSKLTSASDQEAKASFELTIDAGARIDKGDSITLDFGNGDKITVTNPTTGSNATSGTDVAALFGGESVTVSGVKYNITDAGSGTLKFEADKAGMQTGTAAPINGTSVSVAVVDGGSGNATAGSSTTLSMANASAGTDGTAAAQAEVYTAVLDVTKLSAGDTINIGTDATYTIKQEDLADQATLMANVATGLGNSATGVSGKAVQISYDGSTIKATGLTPTTTAGEAAKDVRGDAKIEFKAANPSDTTYKNTVEFDTAKMKDGDTFTFNFDGKTAEVTFNSKDYQTDPTVSAAEKFAKDVAAAFENSGVKVAANGNAVVFEGAKLDVAKDVQLDSAAVDEAKYPHNAIRIQVGALEDEQLAVSIDAMNTAGLKLDEHNLDTQNSASMAITAVRDAINKVSDQRATLGAMQNRLDHKIANLKVSSENLSAAESRIRDVNVGVPTSIAA